MILIGGTPLSDLTTQILCEESRFGVPEDQTLESTVQLFFDTAALKKAVSSVCPTRTDWKDFVRFVFAEHFKVQGGWQVSGRDCLRSMLRSEGGILVPVFAEAVGNRGFSLSLRSSLPVIEMFQTMGILCPGKILCCRRHGNWSKPDSVQLSFERCSLQSYTLPQQSGGIDILPDEKPVWRFRKPFSLCEPRSGLLMVGQK
ncbi:MAG: hypothetical protein KDJ15_02850 [Alphaproteobacteria bacterium]|nr:hypothetical protein [Alphaproteobacteria bacterium]